MARASPELRGIRFVEDLLAVKLETFLRRLRSKCAIWCFVRSAELSYPRFWKKPFNRKLCFSASAAAVIDLAAHALEAEIRYAFALIVDYLRMRGRRVCSYESRVDLLICRCFRKPMISGILRWSSSPSSRKRKTPIRPEKIAHTATTRITRRTGTMMNMAQSHHSG